jgi:DNA-binding response OmpR family regulator
MTRVLLIVEDQPSICFGLSEFFRSRGFEVDCAADATQADALLERKRFGVVITDLSLSGHQNADGLALAARVRRRHPDTRIIILTAYGTRKPRKRRNGSASMRPCTSRPDFPISHPW